MSYCRTYNKSVAKGHGTLIGNWLEEEVLRDASGHTHLESSRHLDTFMRVMGQRPYPVSETFVTSAGRRGRPSCTHAPEAGVATEKHELASRRLQELEAHAKESCLFRKNVLEAKAIEIALKERDEDTEALLRDQNERSTGETESASKYKFQELELGLSEVCGFLQQLESRTPEGSELVTRWSELATSFSSSVQQTPHTGRLPFGKDNSFSLPAKYFVKVRPSFVTKIEFQLWPLQDNLPALQAFKSKLREALMNSKGCLGFLMLKAVLKELSDERSLVPAKLVEQFLWEDFEVNSSDIPVEHLRSALKILTLVDKTSIRVEDLVDFIWAALAPCRSNILAALQNGATRPTEVNALGANAPTLRITRHGPQIRLDSIPDFLHQFLPEGHSEGADGKPSKVVALPHLLEVLTDLSQGVLNDAAFLATVNDIAKQEGIAL
ncbi:hypothetical protein Esti_000972 [Eimeria stiedai]